ncbi:MULTISPECIES: winged helix-turn-helix domain-containing protein [Shewanella]|uniref:Winged helix-turn-helix domain-containing protein n=1 Tax=Shewanella metallivivens TaxID=2872342 RepID=A0ABT5TN55_9GAMM|nr:winged helix-turn-helix domain-containing protein [Shewanella metallivivens]MDD8058861.1 winged helix-turn-helix domain-containing protein [Shewanella metallivivens]
MFSQPNVINKSQKAFLRKLYLAHLLDEEQHNLLSLQKLTGMPRRTLQDAIAAFADIGVKVDFIQQGQRHNEGYYRISTWGPISSAWVNSHFEQIKAVIEDVEAQTLAS